MAAETGGIVLRAKGSRYFRKSHQQSYIGFANAKEVNAEEKLWLRKR